MTSVEITADSIPDLSSKVAIVTGGASGIGLAVVQLLLAKGSTVVFADRDVVSGTALAARLGPSATFIACDVSDWPQLRNVFTQTKKRHGRVDLVFANAGVAEHHDIFAGVAVDGGEDLQEPDYSVLEVNLKSVVATTRLALAFFRANPTPGGSIILTASTSGYNERPNLPVYSTAKHGVVGLLRAIRHRAAQENVTIAAIAPGGTETGMLNETVRAAFRANGIDLQPPSYVAAAAVTLASSPVWNGKALVLIGSHATEVEGPLTELLPQWYGQYNVDMATKAASINWTK